METLKYADNIKAIKEHICNFCGFKILKEEVYNKSTHKYEGKIYDWKAHKSCTDLANTLKMYDEADEGVTQEIFTETVHNTHDDILINLFPKEEINKYSDVIQQLRRVSFKDKLRYVIKYYKI